LYTWLRINDVVIYIHIHHAIIDVNIVGLNNIAAVNKTIVIVVRIAINLTLLHANITVL